MKVLFINGSPHEKGCTYTALHEVEKELNAQGIDTEIFWIGVNPISGCTACRGCYESGRCVIDDGVNEILSRSAEFDGFVFGSPVHYAGISGAMSSFMDRLFYAGDGFENKPAACVVSCRRAGSTAAFEQLTKYPTISNMPLVSSQYWNMVHGSTAEEAARDAEGMQTMRTLGRNMAWLLKSLEAGRQAGIALPEREEPVRTNFIR